METTPATVTPPAAAAAERRCSPKVKRQRKAAALPLGDVTNLLPNTPTNITTRRPRPLPSDFSAAAPTCSASSSLTPVSKPSSAAASDERSLVKSAISTVYTRRNTTEKRRMRMRIRPTNDKAPFSDGTASCPPPARVAKTNRKTSVDQDACPISSSAPCRQAKKKKNTRTGILSSGKAVLPEDFVKKQKAYFEEIDAFELPEEEASETDLE
ncbi:hypothetical protein ABZP36_034348 [Zizania latifolia]